MRHLSGTFLIAFLISLELFYFLTFAALKAVLSKNEEKEWKYKVFGAIALFVSGYLLVSLFA